MPILNRAAEMQDEVAGWRRQLHQQPELNFDVFKTADFVTHYKKKYIYILSAHKSNSEVASDI